MTILNDQSWTNLCILWIFRKEQCYNFYIIEYYNFGLVDMPDNNWISSNVILMLWQPFFSQLIATHTFTHKHTHWRCFKFKYVCRSTKQLNSELNSQNTFTHLQTLARVHAKHTTTHAHIWTYTCCCCHVIIEPACINTHYIRFASVRCVGAMACTWIDVNATTDHMRMTVRPSVRPFVQCVHARTHEFERLSVLRAYVECKRVAYDDGELSLCFVGWGKCIRIWV